MKIILPDKKLKVLDIAVYLVVISFVIFSVIYFAKGRSSNTDYIIVTTDHGTAEYSLSEDTEIEIFSAGYTYTLRIKDGEGKIISADCPDKVCVASRAIGKNGGSIVCVPGKLIVEGSAEGGVDIVLP